MTNVGRWLRAAFLGAVLFLAPLMGITQDPPGEAPITYGVAYAGKSNDWLAASAFWREEVVPNFIFGASLNAEAIGAFSTTGEQLWTGGGGALDFRPFKGSSATITLGVGAIVRVDGTFTFAKPTDWYVRLGIQLNEMGYWEAACDWEAFRL